jgi:hypothetical protein
VNEYQQTIKESFERMDTEEILCRINTGTLTKEATAVASEVLDGRKADLKKIADRHVAAKENSVRHAKIESAVNVAERLPLPPDVRARLWRKAFLQSLIAYAALVAIALPMWWLYQFLQPGHISARLPIKFIWALPFLPLVLLLLPVIIFFDEKTRYVREQVKKAMQ